MSSGTRKSVVSSGVFSEKTPSASWTRAGPSLLRVCSAAIFLRGLCRCFRHDKKEQSELLLKEYRRHGEPCRGKSIPTIIKEAEILLSKNMSFVIAEHESQQYIRCDNQTSAWLPADVRWQTQVFKHSETGIPYVASADGKRSEFAISFFQEKEAPIAAVPVLPGQVLQPCKADPTHGSASMAGQKATGPELPLSDSVAVMVCGCGEEKAECAICDAGFLQEVRRGRVPKTKAKTSAGPVSVANMNKIKRLCSVLPGSSQPAPPPLPPIGAAAVGSSAKLEPLPGHATLPPGPPPLPSKEATPPPEKVPEPVVQNPPSDSESDDEKKAVKQDQDDVQACRCCIDCDL